MLFGKNEDKLRVSLHVAEASESWGDLLCDAKKRYTMCRKYRVERKILRAVSFALSERSGENAKKAE